jgi:hypothetical protein
MEAAATLLVQDLVAARRRAASGGERARIAPPAEHVASRLATTMARAGKKRANKRGRRKRSRGGGLALALHQIASTICRFLNEPKPFWDGK